MKWFAFLFILFFTQVSFAQTEQHDEKNKLESFLEGIPVERASVVLDSLVKHSIELGHWEAAVLPLDYWCYRNRASHQKVIDYLQSDGIQSLLNQLPSDNLDYAKILVDQGYHYVQLKNDALALKSYDKALSIYNKLKLVNSSVIYAYRKAGNVAMRFVDYEKAAAYYQAVLRIDTSGQWHADAYAALAKMANYQRAFPQAIQYYEKGRAVAEKSKDVFNNQCEGAIAYANWGQAQKAENLLAENRRLLESAEPKFRRKNIDQHFLICTEVYVALQELEKAKVSIEQSIGIALEKNKDKKSRELAKRYVRLGHILTDQAKYSEALKAFHDAMQQAFPAFTNSDVLANPPLEQVGSESFMMTTAKGKANTYLKLYEADQNPKWLLPAVACFDIAFSGAKNLRQTFADEGSKFYLELFNAQSLEQAIYACYLGFTSRQDSTFVKKAYQYSEQHKSLVLREAVLKNRSLSALEVPGSLLARERSLHEQILSLKLDLQNEKYINEALSEALSKAQNEYSFLLAGLKKSYPEFAQRIQQRNYVGVENIQSELLDEQTALLQFHWGDQRVFIFQIEKRGYNLSSVPRKSLDTWLDKYLKLLPDRVAQESDPARCFELAYQLYQQLLSKSVNALDKDIRRLILIPDGALLSLPFEALMDKPYEGSFAKAPYLLKRFDIQYAHSPSLILQAADQKKQLSGMLAVAPLFANNERGLPALNQSITEIESVQPGVLEFLKGEAASLDAFRERAPKKQIIHLSTHAKANTENREPMIEFIDGSLPLSQVYTMEIPAELVVLSACESNLGAYAKGEGVMSLSRGFAYAGAESMIASLWAVNENSTAQLFENYYLQLKEHTKAAALNKSKLVYLQNPEIRDRYKAPYYWSGFVFTGKDGFVDLSANDFFNYWWLLTVVFILAGALLFYRKQ